MVHLHQVQLTPVMNKDPLGSFYFYNKYRFLGVHCHGDTNLQFHDKNGFNYKNISIPRFALGGDQEYSSGGVVQHADGGMRHLSNTSIKENVPLLMSHRAKVFL